MGAGPLDLDKKETDQGLQDSLFGRVAASRHPKKLARQGQKLGQDLAGTGKIKTHEQA